MGGNLDLWGSRREIEYGRKHAKGERREKLQVGEWEEIWERGEEAGPGGYASKETEGRSRLH